MKTLAILFATATVALSASAQEPSTSLIDAQYYGFEHNMPNSTMGKMWITPDSRNSVSVTDQNAASGEYALKFDCADFPSNSIVQAQATPNINNDAIVSLEAGSYVVYSKVFLPENAPSGFEVTLTVPYVRAIFSFKNVVRNKWVEISTKVKLSEPTTDESRLTVLLREQEKFGGVGSFYVDDIRIVKQQ